MIVIGQILSFKNGVILRVDDVRYYQERVSSVNLLLVRAPSDYDQQHLLGDARALLQDMLGYNPGDISVIMNG